ncbi:hypothetical protein ACP4OV_027350 [Aristida adscensionis]
MRPRRQRRLAAARQRIAAAQTVVRGGDVAARGGDGGVAEEVAERPAVLTARSARAAAAPVARIDSGDSNVAAANVCGGA